MPDYVTVFDVYFVKEKNGKVHKEFYREFDHEEDAEKCREIFIYPIEIKPRMKRIK